MFLSCVPLSAEASKCYLQGLHEDARELHHIVPIPDSYVRIDSRNIFVRVPNLQMRRLVVFVSANIESRELKELSADYLSRTPYLVCRNTTTLLCMLGTRTS